MAEIKLPTLPCYPCPHDASCCAYGTTVTDDEAAQIARDWGEEGIYRLKSGEWRTRVRAGRCVFFVDGGCSIYNKPYYPAVCAGFPFVDAEHGGPYESDRTICGEFHTRPELHAVYPFVKPVRRESPAGLD